MNSDVEFDLSIIGTVGLPARYGGFETLAEELASRLALSHRVCVYCTRTGRSDFPDEHLGSKLRYVAFDANGLQSVPYDIVSMWRAAFTSRTLLVLGVSGCMFLPILRAFAPRVRIVTNIDGLEWKREKWGLLARLFLRASEAMAVRFSDAIIADNRAIQNHVSVTYNKPSDLIAYGGDNQIQVVTAAISRDTRFAAGTYFFSLCRIEPENNIHQILDAFRCTPSSNLVFVGNWDVSDYGRKLRRSHSDFTNIELLNPIYDRSRLSRLRSEALGYIHGHSAGGTNPSLVESMMAGMAVIAYDVHYNRHTTHGRARYWNSSAELAGLLSTVKPDTLQSDAFAMRALAEELYTWDRIVREYEAVIFTSLGDD